MGSVERWLEPLWRRSDLIFSLVGPRLWTERPLPLRHPPIFYLGHLPAFSWNQIGRGLLGLGPVDARLDVVMERGIDPADAASASASARDDWPSVLEVLDYRDRVRARLREVEADVDERGERMWRVVAEHEAMHHETLLYLLQQADIRDLRRPSSWPPAEIGKEPRRSRQVWVPAGEVQLGEDSEKLDFGWDNESPRRVVSVQRFRMDDLPVTNARYLEYVEKTGARPPISWRHSDSGWEVRSLFAWYPLAEVSGWPAVVSHVEASGFAAWAGARLPTEPEWVRAAGESAHGTNTNFVWGSPRAVGRSGQGPYGHLDLVGGVWSWTDSVFDTYEGFQPLLPSYPGYSADFFDGQHRVVRGASWATDANLVRPTFRNWYRADYAFAFIGFRLVWA